MHFSQICVVQVNREVARTVMDMELELVAFV